MKATGFASPGIFDSTPSPALRSAQTLFISFPKMTGKLKPRLFFLNLFSIRSFVSSISSFVFLANSIIRIAPGSPSIKNLFLR